MDFANAATGNCAPLLICCTTSFGTHGPMGPWIVTWDRNPDAHARDLNLAIDDKSRQHANGLEIPCKVPAPIEQITTGLHLQAEDTRSTSTLPSGGGMFAPPHYLLPGDAAQVRIKAVRQLGNAVVDERRCDMLPRC